MNIRKTLIIVVSIIILLLFGLVSSISYNAGMSYGEQNAESIRESRITDSISHEKTLKIVSVQIANNSNQNSEIKSSGRVVSLNNITITSETSGKLEGNFSIKKGVKFRKGSILFKVKNTDIDLLVKAKKSKFMNLLSSNLAEIKLDFTDEYKKWDDFFNSLSLEKTIGNLPETNSSKEKNFIISRGIMSEYLSVKSDEEKLRKYTVRAPFDGVISKSYTDIGANVNMGSPVIDVIRDGKKEVELTINTSENEFIKIGSEVLLTNGTNTFFGKITRKGNFVNEKTQNISVFTEISSNTEMIYSGMYLEGTISSNITNNVCKIPRRSIFSENNIVKAPINWTCLEAATLPCAALTAWRTLVTEGQINKDTIVLVQGLGGVSIFAIQIAKLFNAKVIATTSSDNKMIKAKTFGADFVINYNKNKEWWKYVQKITNKQGVDIVVEVGGSKTLEQSIRSSKIGGVIGVIGVLSGGIAELPIGRVIYKASRLVGITCGSKLELTDMIEKFNSSNIKPIIDSTFKFEDLPKALKYMKAGQHTGKIAIDFN